MIRKHWPSKNSYLQRITWIDINKQRSDIFILNVSLSEPGAHWYPKAQSFTDDKTKDKTMLIIAFDSDKKRDMIRYFVCHGALS